MSSVRYAAIDAGYRSSRSAPGRNAAVKAFIQFAAFKVHVTCAAFLAAAW